MPGFQTEDEAEREEGDYRFLPKPFQLDECHCGQVIPVVLLHEGHGAAEHIGCKVDVGVGEDQPITGGLFEGSGQRVGLAQPAGREFGKVDDLEIFVGAGKFVQDLSGGVVGAVVDGDDFVARVVLRQQGSEGGGKFFGLVAGSDKDGDRRAVVVGRGGHLGKPGEAGHPADGTDAGDDPGESHQTEQPRPEVVHG